MNQMKQNERDSLIAEFKRCLSTMSHSRAGWDYQLSREQRAEEDQEEREALARSRAIWSGNPAMQDDLRTAFTEASPLATLREIENAPAALSRATAS